MCLVCTVRANMSPSRFILLSGNRCQTSAKILKSISSIYKLPRAPINYAKSIANASAENATSTIPSASRS